MVVGDDLDQLKSADAILPTAAPPAATSGANLTFESGLRLGSCSNVEFKSSTRIKLLLVVPLIPTFARESAAKGSKCRNRTTSQKEQAQDDCTDP